MPAQRSEQSADGPDLAVPDNGVPLPAEVRVYIASDVRLYRDGLSASLSRLATLRVVGAGSLPAALREVAEARPDVLLLDLGAEGSLSLPRRAQLVAPALRVLAFAVAEVESNVLACAEAGICGYVPEDASAEDLATAVTLAMRGEMYCSPRIAALLFRRVAALPDVRPVPSLEGALTRREREIAGLLAGGFSNKEIARRLRLGHPTVKNHVHNILRKLDIRRRGQVAQASSLVAETMRQPTSPSANADAP